MYSKLQLAVIVKPIARIQDIPMNKFIKRFGSIKEINLNLIGKIQIKNIICGAKVIMIDLI